MYEASFVFISIMKTQNFKKKYSQGKYANYEEFIWTKHKCEMVHNLLAKKTLELHHFIFLEINIKL